MFPYHQILADYTPLILMYVVDAHPVAVRAATVKLTVLVLPDTSNFLVDQMRQRLIECMDIETVEGIASAFNFTDVKSMLIQWDIIVKRYGSRVP